MARSALPENAILLGLEKEGGQLPAAKLPKSIAKTPSDREKLLELLSSKALVRVDDGLVMLTASGLERVREIHEEAQAAVDAKAAKKKAADDAKFRKADAAKQKKEAAAAKKRAKAEAAAAKKALAVAEKRRVAAAKASISALAALAKDSKRIAAKGLAPAERARRAQAVHAALTSDLLPQLAELVALLGGSEPAAAPSPTPSSRQLRAEIENTLRSLNRQVSLPDLRARLGVSREQLHPTLLAMLREDRPVIDLEIAYDRAAVPDQSEGILTESGLLYFISLRR